MQSCSLTPIQLMECSSNFWNSLSGTPKISSVRNRTHIDGGSNRQVSDCGESANVFPHVTHIPISPESMAISEAVPTMTQRITP